MRIKRILLTFFVIGLIIGATKAQSTYHSVICRVTNFNKTSGCSDGIISGDPDWAFHPRFTSSGNGYDSDAHNDLCWGTTSTASSWNVDERRAIRATTSNACVQVRGQEDDGTGYWCDGSHCNNEGYGSNVCLNPGSISEGVWTSMGTATSTGSGRWRAVCEMIRWQVPDPNFFTGYGFTDNQWSVLVYDNSLSYGSEWSDLRYSGYYTETSQNLSINTTSRWTNAPSDASGYKGVTVGVDNHAYRYKRRGFDCGRYQLDFANFDDDIWVYVDGNLVYQRAGSCCVALSNVWTGFLTSTSTFEVRVKEGGGGSEVRFSLVKQENWTATASVSPTPVCVGDGVTFTGGTASTLASCGNGSSSVNKGIPDNNAGGTDGYIVVSGTGVNANAITSVLMNVNHTWNNDVVATLYAPNGSNIVILGNKGGSGDNINVTLVSSGTALPTGNTGISGTFQVQNAFSGLTGSADGTWRLNVRDGATNDVGTFNSWALNLNTTCTASYAWSGANSFSSSSQNPTRTTTTTSDGGSYTVTVTQGGCSKTATTNLTVQAINGTAGTYGTNEWYVSCYRSNNFTNYTGFYKSARSNEFNVGADGMAALSNPTTIVSGTINGAAVTGFSGCNAQWSNDNWSFDARRQGFTCGVYQLEVIANDDNYNIEIDYDGNGTIDVSRTGTCCNGANLGLVGVSPYVLNSSSKVRVTLVEGGGDAYLDVNFNTVSPAALSGGTISGITDGVTICAGGDPGSFSTSGVASGGAGTAYLNGSYTFDWESSITSSSSGFSSLSVSTQTYDPSALTTTTWFRRKVTDKCGNVAYSNVIQVNVVADPVAPTLNVATPASGSSICLGGSVSATTNAGTGGVSCTDSYQYSTNGGFSWTAYTPGNSIVSTETGNGKIILQAKRDCSGTGCDGAGEVFTTIAQWTVVAQPVAGTLAPNIADGSTVCTGQSLSATFSTGSGGVSPVDVVEFSTGGAFASYIPGNSISTASLAGQTVTIRTQRTSSGTGCNNSGYNQVSWTVVADPVAQTITPNPAAGAICESASVSATFSGGSGGTGTITDVYEYSTNGGSSWASYTSGNSISAAGLAGQTIKIRTRRTATGSGCDNSAYNEVSWPVSITTAITSATAAADPICPAATTTLTANGVTGTSTTITWWSGAGGTGTNYGTGATSVQGPGIYYARVTGDCGNAEASVTVNAKTLSVAATSTTANPMAACAGQTIALDASGHTLGTGATINWYTATGGGGTNLGAGTSQTHVPTASTTYYARIVGDCNTVETNTGLVTVGASNNVVLSLSSTESNESTCEDGAWTYYESNENVREGKYIFAIRWNGATQKGTEAVTITTAATPWAATGSVTVAGVTAPGGSWAMPRYWNVTIGGSHGVTLSQPVDVRFYYDPAEITATEAARDAYVTANSGAGTVSEGNVWFKTQGVGFDPANMTANSIVGGNQPLWTLTPTFGTENGISYAQFDGLTSFSGGGFGSGAGVPGGTPLPIELTYFKGTKVNEASALLEWATATETDNDFFVVERSGNGVNFQELGVVDGAGTSNVAHTYRFSDNNPLAGDNYYRLRQVDFNGESSHSHVVVLNFEKDFSVNVFPNPFNDKFSVDIYTEQGSDATVEVFDMAGRLVQNIQRGILSGYNRIDIDGNALVHGSYMVRVIAGDKVSTATIVKK